jgi:hypothetical protein
VAIDHGVAPRRKLILHGPDRRWPL